MAPAYLTTINVFIGAALSVVTTFIFLRAENMKQIMTRKHEFSVKELGEKIFSPLLIELVRHETKKKLGRHHTFPVQTIIDTISINQYLLIFANDNVRNIINNIYEFGTSTSSDNGNTIKTQDELIIEELCLLREELNSIYSKYRM
ncbi:hypothetical protein MHH60_20165 [Paenibacillus sp. FSL H7-0716]|uniref:Uncharacterized protein n=1 Tax=Paenibacillus odorifer TaxID=189426 RepID=A0AB36J8K4_9BACL|nr:hypothetical protein [Paenibacillus odorifer]OME16529.1 hypothetical protein BSK47_19900 [Paenibacillus odorifer]